MKRYSSNGTEVELSHQDVATVVGAITSLMDESDTATSGKNAMILERTAAGLQAFLLDKTPPIVPVNHAK